ncbi:MAG: hypothetical protein OEN01_15435 [Candidatus Krumholzibacteria bacterium]|nr:hypothetical protein [Candidatus Krumholzibacteria bacterium]
MTPRFFIDVFGWLLIWVAAWGFYGFMLRRQINYVNRFPITSVYFLALSILIIISFRGTFAQIATDLELTPLIALALVYVTTIALYHLSHAHLKKPARLISMNPQEFFLTLDYRYLTSKSFELLFQQVMIVLLILTIHRTIPTMINVMALYGVIFATAHIPIYPLIGTKERIFKLVYSAAAIASAIVFPVLILTVSYGFVYTYIIHLSFYTLFALFLWGRNTVLGNELSPR